MKNSLRGHRHIHNLRVLHPHDRQKHALHRMAHIEVLLRRRPHYRGQINRLFAACHALHMKDGKLPFERIKTGVIAKWSFGACFVQVHEALEHDFRVRRDLQVVGLAGNHFHRLAPQKSSEHHFVKIGRDWQHSRQRRRRVRPNGHAHRNPPCGILRSRAAKMLCSVLLRLPVHTRGPLVIHLHAIHSNVSLARLGILRKHQRERDKAPSILRPCLQDRKIKQIDVGSLSNDFLARAILDALGEKRPQFRQLWQHLDFVKEPLWRLHLEKALNPLRHLVQLPHLEGQLHTSHAAECIDQHGHARAFRVLKQQRHIRQNLPPCLWRSPWSEAACARLRPAHPLHHFRNLQHRVHFRADSLQFPFLLQRPHKFPQIPIRHFSLRSKRISRASTLARTLPPSGSAVRSAQARPAAHSAPLNSIRFRPETLPPFSPTSINPATISSVAAVFPASARRVKSSESKSGRSLVSPYALGKIITYAIRLAALSFPSTIASQFSPPIIRITSGTFDPALNPDPSSPSDLLCQHRPSATPPGSTVVLVPGQYTP